MNRRVLTLLLALSVSLVASSLSACCGCSACIKDPPCCQRPAPPKEAPKDAPAKK